MRVGGSTRLTTSGVLLAATLLISPCHCALLAAQPATDIVIAEDTPSQPFPIAIEGLALPISFSARSSNSVLVPETNMVFRGTAREPVIVITPASNQAGTTSVSVHATDGTTTITQRLNLTVTAVNDAPTISRIPDQIMSEGGSMPPVSFTIGDIETPAASLIVSAGSSDTTLLRKDAIVLSGDGAIRTIVARPTAGKSGIVRVSVTVSDGEAATTREFAIGIGTVNHAPIANAGPDQTLVATNAIALNGTATDDSTDRLTTSWSVTAGPSSVEFSNPSSLNTTARFTAHGVYTLRLTASDGELEDTDDMTVVVSGGAIARAQEPREKRR
jgi:hypothetical protein